MRSILLLSISMLAATTAFAKLGEHESTIESDRQAMRGVRKMVAKEGFHVHEITAQGQTIREYVDANGMVFAVSWKGISHPDLTQLFGSYYQEYQDADSAMPTPKGRAPKKVESASVTVHRFGHMRDVHGKAYVPSLVPDGFDLNQIQ